MPPPPVSEKIKADVERVSRLSSVPTILKVVSETTGLRFAAVARVTEGEWVTCAVHDLLNFGLKPGEPLPVETTLCKEVRETRAPVVMDQASTDPRYCAHQTPKSYGFESYISVPIVLPDGEYFGTVCALDPLPAKVTQPKVVSMVTLFADLIAVQLAALKRDEEAQSKLLAANEAAELREQFIAVLGHDLRNPLSSVNMGADMLLRRPLADADRKTVERIRTSGRRMTRLVTDLLDFARARLGDGIGLRIEDVGDLEVTLRHVVAELESGHPDRELRFEGAIAAPVRCDRERVAQLLSNLVANALEHGDPKAPVEVKVATDEARLTLSVRNQGPPIPKANLAKLFRPYARGVVGGQAQSGLGLGLFIVHEIARAHGGEIEVRSSDEGTCFTFVLPLGREAQPGQLPANVKSIHHLA